MSIAFARRYLLALAAAVVAGAAFAPASALAGPDPLAAAWRKELAFLEAEEAALAARLREAEAATRREQERAAADLGSLEARVAAARRAADAAEQALAALEREAPPQQAAEGQAALAEVLDRAEETIAPVGGAVPKQEDAWQLEAGITRLGAGAAALIQRGGALRVETEQAFFARDGSALRGSVVRFGEIARYAVTKDAKVAGALAPAGGTTMRMWPDDAASTAQALAAGSVPPTLEILLTERMDKALEPKPKEGPLTLVEKGGAVAWVIVGLGLFGALLALLRGLLLVWLGRGKRRLRRLVAAIEVAARETPAEAARSGSQRLIEAEAARVPGALGRVARRTLQAARHRRETLDDAISEALLGEEAGIERFHSAIGVIAAVAPLLGLLGTVTGMIATFDIITELGTGDPKMLSSGISEALITTELGLVVAIPLLLLGTLLGGLSARIASSLEAAALAIANRTPPAAPEAP